MKPLQGLACHNRGLLPRVSLVLKVIKRPFLQRIPTKHRGPGTRLDLDTAHMAPRVPEPAPSVRRGGQDRQETGERWTGHPRLWWLHKGGQAGAAVQSNRKRVFLRKGGRRRPLRIGASEPRPAGGMPSRRGRGLEATPSVVPGRSWFHPVGI